MMTYEVTIGIPVYNAETVIRQTMDSALAQTFENIEFLILDDCGTDSTIAIIEEYQQLHPRGKDIHVVSQEFNKGIGAARNRILKEAQGRYLFFLDADDLILPTTIELLVSMAKKYQAEVVLGSYERRELYLQETKSSQIIHPRKIFLHENEFATYAFSRYAILEANIWNVLMDLEFVKRTHLQFVNTNFWEDIAFKYELVTFVTRAVLLPDITYYYICRENSLSNYQTRREIGKDEVFRNIATIDTLKYRYADLVQKPYFRKWLQFVLDTDFYIVSDVLQKRDIIRPKVSNKELRNILSSPLSIIQTLRLANLKCWLYKLLTLLPSDCTVGIIRMMMKIH